MDAAHALGRLYDTRAVEPLITAFLKDEAWEVRREAARALGELGDARAVEPLIAALKDADSEVRARAVEALGRFGERAVEPLITVLRDEDRQIRGYVAVVERSGIKKDIIRNYCVQYFRQKEANVQIIGFQDGYIELIVTEIKREVIKDKDFWEKIQIVINYYKSANVLKIICLMDGQFAGGIGENPSPNEGYTDMEPRYTQQLHNYANEWIVNLTDFLTTGTIP